MSSLHEGAELVAESGRTYLAVHSLGQDNVWIASEKDKDDHIVILKSPSSTDSPGIWPKFQQEMTMHELFKDCPTIRQQIDRAAPTKSGSPPVLVLEMCATTVWMARKKRPFARPEIVAIIKGLFEGLRDVHAKGLVYADIKMPNLMLDGFDNHTPSDGSDLTVKLGDLGEVMYPSTGTAQPIAYRAPEVILKGEIGPAADIWAAGLVLSHLLEAQTNFSETGLYNDIRHAENSNAVQKAQALGAVIAKDYDLQNTDYYRNCDLESLMGADHVNSWDALQGRLSPEDIAFLQDIMQADPRVRPSAASLLQHPWFKGAASTPKPTAEVSDTADANMAEPEPVQVIANTTERSPPTNSTNSHAPMEFQSINNTLRDQSFLPSASSTAFENTAGSPSPAQTTDAARQRTTQNGTNQAYAPIEFQSQPATDVPSDHKAAPLKVDQNTNDASEAPQLSPVRTFSPITFRDINATTLPDDDNAPKRVSSHSLVDSKHKRESIHFQPISVGTQQQWI